MSGRNNYAYCLSDPNITKNAGSGSGALFRSRIRIRIRSNLSGSKICSPNIYTKYIYKWDGEAFLAYNGIYERRERHSIQSPNLIRMSGFLNEPVFITSIVWHLWLFPNHPYTRTKKRYCASFRVQLSVKITLRNSPISLTQFCEISFTVSYTKLLSKSEKGAFNFLILQGFERLLNVLYSFLWWANYLLYFIRQIHFKQMHFVH